MNPAAPKEPATGESAAAIASRLNQLIARAGSAQAAALQDSARELRSVGVRWQHCELAAAIAALTAPAEPRRPHPRNPAPEGLDRVQQEAAALLIANGRDAPRLRRLMERLAAQAQAVEALVDSGHQLLAAMRNDVQVRSGATVSAVGRQALAQLQDRAALFERRLEHLHRMAARAQALRQAMKSLGAERVRLAELAIEAVRQADESPAQDTPDAAIDWIAGAAAACERIREEAEALGQACRELAIAAEALQRV